MLFDQLLDGNIKMNLSIKKRNTMKKIVLIFFAISITACATVPAREYHSASEDSVSDVEAKMFQMAKKCWAKKATLLEDGFKVEDGRANGVYRIETYGYASDGRTQTKEIIEISVSEGKTKILIKQPELTDSFNSSRSQIEDKRWHDMNNWINGNYTCS